MAQIDEGVPGRIKFPWTDTPDGEKRGWEASAEAVRRYVLSGKVAPLANHRHD